MSALSAQATAAEIAAATTRARAALDDLADHTSDDTVTPSASATARVEDEWAHERSKATAADDEFAF